MPLRRLAEAAGVLALATALTVLMTWPLVPRLGKVGRVNTGDGQLSIWNVAWVARTLVADPRNLYNANIFYPHKGTLAYSESNLGAGVLALPIWWLTHNPYAAHNFALAAAFALTLCTTYLLARYLTGRPAAAIVAGIAFTFCPFMFARFAHIQLVMAFGLPLSLWAFHRLVDRPHAGRALTLGAALWIQAMTCSYYAVFAALVVGLGVFFFAWTRGLWRSPAYWMLVGLAAAVSIAATIPFFLPYLRVQDELGFTRTILEARTYSADWRSWLASSAWAHRWLLPMLREWKEVLFPGVVVTLLGLAGGFLALTRTRPDSASPALPASARLIRQTAGFYLLTLGLALWASFGPDAGLYAFFFRTVPIFSLLQAPARFGLLVALCLSILAAMALIWLIPRRRTPAVVTTAAIAAVLAGELVAAPVELPDARAPAPAYRVLARLQPGVVAEFPFFFNRPDFPRHAFYMLNSTHHWRPLVNGYSDLIPDDFRRSVLRLSTFPSRDAFRLLQEKQTRYALFHLRFYDDRSRAKLLDSLENYREFLKPLFREGDVWLYEIVAWPRQQ